MHRRVLTRVLTALPLVLLLATLSGLVLSQAACVARGSGPPQPRTGERTSPSLPNWVGQSMSWDKLVSIQDWLLSRGANNDPFWRIEGELLLADGRHSLAREELGRPGTGSRKDRLASSEAGFRRVIQDPQATPSQGLRAKSGLRRVTGGSATNAALKVLPEIRLRQTWNARRAIPSKLTTHHRTWQWITVHHSALEGADRLDGSLAATERALRQVQKGHMDARGYGDVGYHFLIGPGGRIFEGRQLRYQGAHVRGDAGQNLNPGNIGICVIGNFDEEQPTHAAVVALGKLTLALRENNNLPPSRVRAHRHWKATACPGKNLLPYVERLR